MLSEEEKQAMKYFYNLRATIDESNMLFDEDIDVKCGKETIKQITIILNLIEKQSKEIEELKKQDLSNSKIRDKIRNRIKYLTEYYEKEVKPEMYHWGDFTAEEYYAGIIIELKMILFKDCMVDN